MKEALEEAERLREQGDPHHLGSVFLQLYQRQIQLEKVAEAADRFLRFGLDPMLHADLVRALEKLKKMDEEEDYRLGGSAP
ncbi:MAG: hypothetical protein D6819_00235 [Gammaproteobacteria bacterium]|nr:MAG: hypothetical protein D6819_00235 [Gammaproteobacteria bacterium]